VIPSFRTERALVVDVFDIGLNKHKRLVALPRPVGGIEAAALLAGTAGCGRVASEDVSDGVGREVNALLCVMMERFYRRCACFFQVWVEDGEQGWV